MANQTPTPHRSLLFFLFSLSFVVRRFFLDVISPTFHPARSTEDVSPRRRLLSSRIASFIRYQHPTDQRKHRHRLVTRKKPGLTTAFFDQANLIGPRGGSQIRLKTHSLQKKKGSKKE